MIKFIEADNLTSINNQLAKLQDEVGLNWALDEDKTTVDLKVEYRPYSDWTIDGDPKTSYTEVRHYICKAYFNKREIVSKDAISVGCDKALRDFVQSWNKKHDKEEQLHTKDLKFKIAIYSGSELGGRYFTFDSQDDMLEKYRDLTLQSYSSTTPVTIDAMTLRDGKEGVLLFQDTTPYRLHFVDESTVFNRWFFDLDLAKKEFDDHSINFPDWRFELTEVSSGKVLMSHMKSVDTILEGRRPTDKDKKSDKDKYHIGKH